MMNLNALIKSTGRIIRANSPSILTAFGVSGTITTAYLTGKATIKAVNAVRSEQERIDQRVKSYPLARNDVIRLVWKFYIPPTISGVVTIGSIIAATRIGSKRTAAAYSILTVSERAFDEYKEKVVEKYGERKEQHIRDEIAQDKVTNNPPPTREVMLAGPGNVLCYEIYTGRYFNSDMESLRKAQNDINAKLLRDDHASASDLYIILGLPYTSHSSYIGWTSDKLLELQFSTCLADDGRPCLAFEYNYINPF